MRLAIALLLLGCVDDPLGYCHVTDAEHKKFQRDHDACEGQHRYHVCMAGQGWDKRYMTEHQCNRFARHVMAMVPLDTRPKR